MSDPIVKSKRIGAAIAGMAAIYLANRYGYEMSPEMQALAGEATNELLYGIGTGITGLISLGLTAWSKASSVKRAITEIKNDLDEMRPIGDDKS